MASADLYVQRAEGVVVSLHRLPNACPPHSVLVAWAPAGYTHAPRFTSRKWNAAAGPDNGRVVRVLEKKGQHSNAVATAAPCLVVGRCRP